MNDIITENKYVELSYQIIDKKTGSTLINVEYPIGYVHGVNDILAPEVSRVLEGHSAGDEIEIPIDCETLYGTRDESLVFTDHIENVPEEYREVGMTITMQNDKGDAKNFIVTRVDDKCVTVDGNNPLCGRKVIFRLDILSVRDATEAEIENGGAADETPNIEGTLKPV